MYEEALVYEDNVEEIVTHEDDDPFINYGETEYSEDEEETTETEEDNDGRELDPITGRKNRCHALNSKNMTNSELDDYFC